ncbi:MAG: LPS assembly lipoprotein LptE [Elusimicrobiales bacterium]|nr:LPS assembly lipoprotein LptE [Elusimicrobiales bacterium]
MKDKIKFLIFTLILSCESKIIYNPAPQILPQHIKSIAIKAFTNKSSIFGIEEKLTLKIIDEFIKDGRYNIKSETDAEGIIVGEVKSYIMTPIQYNYNMIPTAYKITLNYSIKMIDKLKNVVLWEENTLTANYIFSDLSLPGGMSEEQARERLWEIIAKDVVKRTVEGFGSVTGVSSKKL